MSQTRILIIEDDKPLSEVLEYNLNREGYQVFTAEDGREGLDKVRILQPDLVVLDVMLPSLDGLQICSQLRSNSQTQDIIILLLTAKEEEVDEVAGFSMGADDYVIKPFKIRPLLHRIKALLCRRRMDLKQNAVVDRCGIRVDGLNYAAWIEGREIFLTPTELRLLWFLMKEPERTYSRLDLLEACRGEDNCSTARTIDVHVGSLRRKLKARAGLLETVRGVGYRFTPLNEFGCEEDQG